MMMQNNHKIFEQIKMPFARPMHPRGALWVGAAALLTLVGILASWDTTGLLLFITFMLYVCFRDPLRVQPAADDIAIAPADGILTQIDRAPWPPEAEIDGEATRRIINPRFYDVHVLRAPAAAALTSAQHVMGQWGSDVFDKSDTGNERGVVMFKLADGRTLALEIIGGAIAERLRFSARAGDVVSLGQALGYAAFGGEVRLYLPPGTEVIAQIGQHMIAGETAVAALSVAAENYTDYATDYTADEFTGVLPNSAGFRLY